MRRAAAVAALLVVVLWAGLPSAEAAPKRARKKSAHKSSPRPGPSNFDPKLPILGTRLAEMPPGPGKASADNACMTCHSADMVAQQRLTEKQWAAEVTKMTGWGADVPADRREELIAYLVKNFGTEGPKFEPVISRPVGR
ncbi:MAG TPA: cytochrome c [Thermoanaerobaculia bacterium]|nr:cytochrome c [Thermoanaerobaculia bacterium]